MRFDKYLTPEERLSAWRAGLTFKLAEKEVLPSEFDKMLKSAQDASSKAALPLKAMLWLALLSGGALGTIGYFADESVADGGAANNALRRRRNYFQDAASRIKNDLEAENEDA